MLTKIGNALIQHPYVIIGLAPRAVKSRLLKNKNKNKKKRVGRKNKIIYVMRAC